MRATICSLLATAGLLMGASAAWAAPQANDAFADAAAVAIGREYTGSLAEATAELGEPSHFTEGPYHSVWFGSVPRTRLG